MMVHPQSMIQNNFDYSDLLKQYHIKTDILSMINHVLYVCFM